MPKITAAARYADMHTHTCFSHDSKADPDEKCRKAIENHLFAIAFTDHCDIEYANELDVFTPIRNSVAAAKAMNEKYGDTLTVFSGIELGEAIWYPEHAQKALDAGGYDVVLGSVHAVRFRQWQTPFAPMDFSDFSEEELYGYLGQYFSDIQSMLDRFPVDVMTHLTCPCKYIRLICKREIDLHRFDAQIERILHTVLEKDIALEVNTHDYTPQNRYLAPDLWMIERYFALGGRKLTLASDAHRASDSGNGFDDTARTLRKIGFTQAYYYQNRRAYAYDLPNTEEEA